MVVSWTLIGYGRAVVWELPILGTDFTLWRIVISLPIPVFGRRARPLRLRADVSEGRAGAIGMTLSSMIIDSTLWGSVAVLGFMAWAARARRAGVVGARRQHGFHQHRAAHCARRHRLRG